jgi:hypothetical protein
MPAIKIGCPRCGAGLTFGATPAPGTRVMCPCCSTIIALNVPAAQDDTVTRWQGDRVKRNHPSPFHPFTSSPRHPVTAPASEGNDEEGQPLKWVALGLAGLFLLLGVSGGLAALLLAGKKSPPVVNSPDPAVREDRDRQIVNREPGDSDPPPINQPAQRQPFRPPSDPPGAPFRPGPLDRPGDLVATPPRPLTTLPETEQRQVDQAIDRGVAFLKATQAPTGGWYGSHRVGYAALPGLTLLECGVPANDPAVERAAALVRSAVPGLTSTYELGLSILFLDRLGDPRDRPLIQVMALRLVAGQNGDGGWGYNCPLLSPRDHELLLTALQESRPQTPYELFVGPDGQRPAFPPTSRPPGIGEEFLPVIVQQHGNPPNEPPKPNPKPPEKKPDPKRPNKGKPNVANALPPVLQDIPALQNRLEFRAPRSRSDNSNTQFAALALWAARRHEVPMERTLALLEKRFRTSQNPDGGWGYMSGGPQRSGTTPAMTCSGLLGLALGHGILQELQARSAAAGQPVPALANIQDQGLLKGLEQLGRHVGAPREDGRADRLGNLYFLWSLERVGVLFNQKTIGNKDWYRWGAQMLVAGQNSNGSWHSGQYHGSSLTMDTCFALLFLKRANLARDLTEKLEFLVEVKP